MAYGVLRWPPEVARGATIRDLFDSLEGYQEAKGGKRRSNAPTKERNDELKRKYG